MVFIQSYVAILRMFLWTINFFKQSFFWCLNVLWKNKHSYDSDTTYFSIGRLLFYSKQTSLFNIEEEWNKSKLMCAMDEFISESLYWEMLCFLGFSKVLFSVHFDILLITNWEGMEKALKCKILHILCYIQYLCSELNVFCRLWKKSSKIVKTCNWWTGSLVGYHFSKMVFHVCHGSYVLCKYPEVFRKYVFCEFILYRECDLHFSFQFRMVTRNTTRVSEVRGKEFRCSTPRDQFYISKAWFTCHILTLGNVIDVHVMV